jgi:hypothetical protein
MTPDYAEILRLHRKYAARPDEPLWVTFVMLGQEMERVRPERCKACFRTHLEYSRLVDATCSDPFHAAPPPSWSRDRNILGEGMCPTVTSHDRTEP